MRIRTPVDLGALIRDRRTKLGLDQRSLAKKVGVSRQWIVEVEKGKPRAEIASCSAQSTHSESCWRQKKNPRRRNEAVPQRWILIPSLPPHAEKENDQGTRCDY